MGAPDAERDEDKPVTPKFIHVIGGNYFLLIAWHHTCVQQETKYANSH